MKKTEYLDLHRRLIEKRAKLDQAIAGIEALIALEELDQQALPGPKFHQSGAKDPAKAAKNHLSSERNDRFLGKSILESCRILLAESDSPMTANALAEALTRQGYPADPKGFFNTVAAVLNRHHKQGGDVIRVGKNLFALSRQANQGSPSP